MAFNIQEMQMYSIDYSTMEDFCTTLPILRDLQLQKKYIQFWLRALNSAENLNISEVEMLLEKDIELDQFQQSFFIFEQEIFLHFRISYLNNFIDNNPKILEQSSCIDLEEFTKPNSEFLWTSKKVDVEYPTNTRPIIAVPFNFGHHKYLVIDGNHRISAAISKQISSINVLIMSEEEVIDMNIPSSKFDLLIYIFINELHRIVTKRANENLSDLELLEASYLMRK